MNAPQGATAQNQRLVELLGIWAELSRAVTALEEQGEQEAARLMLPREAGRPDPLQRLLGLVLDELGVPPEVPGESSRDWFFDEAAERLVVRAAEYRDSPEAVLTRFSLHIDALAT